MTRYYDRANQFWAFNIIIIGLPTRWRQREDEYRQLYVIFFSLACPRYPFSKIVLLLLPLHCTLYSQERICVYNYIMCVCVVTGMLLTVCKIREVILSSVLPGCRFLGVEPSFYFPLSLCFHTFANHGSRHTHMVDPKVAWAWFQNNRLLWLRSHFCRIGWFSL